MVAMISGVILIAFSVLATLPQGLNWSQDILLFLRGCTPVLAALVGIIAIFVGVADIKDRKEAKKEEQEAQNNS